MIKPRVVQTGLSLLGVGPTHYDESLDRIGLLLVGEGRRSFWGLKISGHDF